MNPWDVKSAEGRIPHKARHPTNLSWPVIEACPEVDFQTVKNVLQSAHKLVLTMAFLFFNAFPILNITEATTCHNVSEQSHGSITADVLR